MASGFGAYKGEHERMKKEKSKKSKDKRREKKSKEREEKRRGEKRREEKIEGTAVVQLLLALQAIKTGKEEKRNNLV